MKLTTSSMFSGNVFYSDHTEVNLKYFHDGIDH